MLPLEHPDRIHVAFDDHRLVNNAGLILPAILAQHLGLPQLVDRYLDLGRAPGRANTGDKIMTLVASALAGGDCIDDADALRAGRNLLSAGGAWSKRPPPWALSCAASGGGPRPAQLGPSKPRVCWARSWAAGAGTRRRAVGPSTWTPPSAKTYGAGQGGGRDHHGYTGQRGYHPLLAVAAGTGDVLMSRLRGGAGPNTARGRRPLPAGDGGDGVRLCRGPGGNSRCGPTAASTPIPSSPLCRKMKVRFSITVRQATPQLRKLIEGHT